MITLRTVSLLSVAVLLAAAGARPQEERPSEPPATSFAHAPNPDDPSWAPGVVIVKLRGEVGTRADRTFASAGGFSATHGPVAASLDAVFARCGTKELKPAFPSLVSRMEREGKTEREIMIGLRRKFASRFANPNDVENVKTHNLSKWYLVKLDPRGDVHAAVETLRNDPNVESAELNRTHHVQGVPNDLRWPELWGMQRIQAHYAWDVTTGDPNLVLAAIDTGVDYNHPDLADNIWFNVNEVPGNGVDDDGNGYVDDFRGWDFAYDDNDPMDGHFHGTHVSGTIAGRGNNGIGVVGVNWQLKIMPVKGLNDGGMGYSSDLAECVIYAAENGARVTSNSWGGGGPDPVVIDAFNYAASLGVASFAAAGNSNSDVAYFSPASIPSVICVAATDSDDLKAGFSNWGNRIDLSAPGVSVLSTIPNGGYASYSGTSMACPHAAGLGALVLSVQPTLDPEQLRFVLRSTADDLGDPGWDPYFGAGRINARRAVGAAEPPNIPPPPTAQFTQPTRGAFFREGALITVYGIASGESLEAWQLEEAASDGWRILNSGTTPVDPAGPLGVWDLRGKPDGEYIARLWAKNSYGYYTWAYLTVGIDSLIVNGWPRYSTQGVAIWGVRALDWDGDGQIEVVAVTSREVMVMTPDGQNKPGWPQPFDPADGNGRTPPVFADFDGNGTKELFVLTHRPWQGKFCYVFASDGTLLRRYVPNGMVSGDYDLSLGSPAVADFDSDGRDEVVFGFSDSNYDWQLNKWLSWFHIYVNRGDPTNLPGWPRIIDRPDLNTLYLSSIGSPAIGDLDRDGSLDVVIGAWNSFWAYRADGTTLPGWPINTGPGSGGQPTYEETSPSLADLDGDGSLEVILVRDLMGPVLIYRADGTPHPGYQAPADRMLSIGPACADLDQDGKIDVAANSFKNEMVNFRGSAIRQSGQAVAGFPVGLYSFFDPNAGWTYGTYRRGAPVVADFDGDLAPDILFSHPNSPRVQAFRGDGTPLPIWTRLTIGDHNICTPWLADIDGDGKLELIAGGMGGDIRIWSTYGTAPTVVWNGEGGDLNNTRRYRWVDTIAPQVVSVDPPDGATQVLRNTPITVRFNDGVNPATITSSTFTFKRGLVSVSGTVSMPDPKTIVFTPSSLLNYASQHTITVKGGPAGVKDWSGNSLASDLVSSFTTTDNDPPGTTSAPSGATTGTIGTAYSYSTSATDPEGDTVQITFDWGDGTTTTTGFVATGTPTSASHTWDARATYLVKARATDARGRSTPWSPTLSVFVNYPPPNTPSAPSGPTAGVPNVTYTYSTSSTDPNGLPIQYRFFWGDGTFTDTAFVGSGQIATASHAWAAYGTNYCHVYARNEGYVWSNPSAIVNVVITTQPPATPSIPSGPTTGLAGVSCTYSTSSMDPDGNTISYTFDWGDGTTTTTAYFASGATASASHTWAAAGTFAVRAKAKDPSGAVSAWSAPLSVTFTSPNVAPSTPVKPTGPASGSAAIAYTYSTSTTDANGQAIAYLFDWGDGTSTTTAPTASGASASALHGWTAAGTYSVKVMATDSLGASSAWSAPLAVTVGSAPSTKMTAAIAHDTSKLGPGVHNFDRVVLFFSGPTNKYAVTPANINQVLPVAGKTWGSVKSVNWYSTTTPPGYLGLAGYDGLVVTFNGSGTTVAVNDTLSVATGTIRTTAGVDYAGGKITGTFGAYLRGDADGNGTITSSDVIYLNNYLFKAMTPPPHFINGDADSSGVLTSSDVIYLNNYLFKGGTAPNQNNFAGDGP